MGYGQYVGRVGALAVALGIGVAVANGGVAHATTDPDPNQDTTQTGQNADDSTAENSGTGISAGAEGPETPTVVVNGVEQNDNDGTTTQRRVKPRVMILDVLRGANILGARRADDVDRVEQPKDYRHSPQQPELNPDAGGASAKLTTPPGNAPAKQAAAGPRVLQQTLAAIAPQSKLGATATARIHPGPTKTTAAEITSPIR